MSNKMSERLERLALKFAFGGWRVIVLEHGEPEPDDLPPDTIKVRLKWTEELDGDDNEQG